MNTAASAHGAQLATVLSDRLRRARTDLVQRWLERIMARVALSPGKIFPSEELLNHVPLLVDGIADYLENPTRQLDVERPVTAKAMELGALRHEQGFDAHEILKEQEIFAGIVFAFLTDVIDEIDVTWSGRDLALCWQHVSQAMELIRQATMTHFLRLSAQQVNEREDRLRRFNRMVAHELKTRVGAIRGAAALLPEPWLDAPQRERFHQMIRENAEGLQHVLENLEALSRIEFDSRRQRNVLLPQAAAEAVRQLREAATVRLVSIEIDADLPAVEVDAAAVELCLVNYLSNAIKYSDPSKSARWARVTGTFEAGTVISSGALTVRVTDNGVGVAPDARGRLFEQFYRAHEGTITDVSGTGLGLSLVRETVESLGGHAWVEFPTGGGATFAFSLPSRRDEDAAAAGTRRVEGGAS
ncbi:MAG: sensor histidine kinase [Gemmatimonadaceae bacterium]